MPSRTTSAASPNSPSSNRRKVFLVEDHPIVRNGLSQVIDGEPDLMVVGQAGEADVCLDAIKAVQPDIVLVDISLKQGDGIGLVKQLRADLPDLPAMMLSMHDELVYAERCIGAGARGYVSKIEPPQILLAVIRQVLGGEVYLSPQMEALLLGRVVGRHQQELCSPMERLTPREMEVFRLIGAGVTVHEIAEKLDVSNKTVEAHREHMKEKLNIRTSAELLRFAVLNGDGQSTPD